MTTESLYVSGFNSVNEQWSETGVSPWLNNSTANYISSSTDEDWHEEFAFADHVGSETLNSTTLYIEIQGNSGRNDYVVIDLYDGSSWSNIAELDSDNDSYQWFNYDVSTLLNSWVKVNAAKLRVQYQRAGSPATKIIYVRRSYLYVDYSSVEIPVLISDSLSLIDNVGKERRLLISDGVDASDGLPRTNKIFSLSDTFDLADVILKQRTIFPLLDSLTLLDLIFKQRTLAPLQDSVGVVDSVLRNKAVLIVDDALYLVDSVTLLRNLGVSDVLSIIDDVSVSYGATQIQVYDTVGLVDGIAKERGFTVQDSLGLADSFYKERIVVPIVDSISLADNQLTDKPVTLIMDFANLTDNILGDKVFSIEDFVSLSETIVKKIQGKGWSGKIIGILGPSKVVRVAKEKIKDIMNVET